MDQLIEQIVARVGLSQEQAGQVVEVVQGFLKDKLPADLMGQLSGALGAVGDTAGAAVGTATGAAADAGANVIAGVDGALGR
jgi:hypothetical protein